VLKESELFEPSQPLYGKQAELFAGRTEALERAVLASLEAHSLVMLYGDLGIGKSSAARQLYMILNQDEYAKRRYPTLTSHVWDTRPRHLVPIWFSCRDYDDMDGVLRAICFSQAQDANDTLAKLFPGFPEKTRKWLIDAALEAKLGVVGASVKAQRTEDQSSQDIAQARDEYLKSVRGIDVFLHLLAKLQEEDPLADVVIILDDFERLMDKSDFPAIFLRADSVRFVLVGIAENPAELVEHNQSLERHLVDRQIRIERLDEQEVSWIFENASSLALKHQGVKKLTFTDAFVREVAGISGGLPMIVQYYGRKALRVSKALLKLNNDAVTIDTDAIPLIEADFFDISKGVEPNLIARIQEGVGQSVARPRVLRAIADRFESWFDLGQVRRIPDLATVSKIEDHLDKLVDARVLAKSDETGRYRFWTPTCRMLCRRVPERNAMPGF